MLQVVHVIKTSATTRDIISQRAQHAHRVPQPHNVYAMSVSKYRHQAEQISFSVTTI
jgi:hypothetical protein